MAGFTTYLIELVGVDSSGCRVFHMPDADISALEKMEDGLLRYFAWNGIAGDIRRNRHTATYGTMDEAIDEAISLRYMYAESDALQESF